MSFFVHGLNFDSVFDLDATHPTQASTTEAVQITSGKVSLQGLDNPIKSYAMCQIAQSQVWINIPNIARYLISDGANIVVDAEESADKASINTFLESMAISAALYQRGLVPLKACAVNIDNEAVIITGASGVGKSTVAAAFRQRGYQIISDDIVSITDQGLAHYGFSHVKLWEDSLIHFELAFEAANQVRNHIRKYATACSKPNSLAPIPVKAIYLLEQANATHFSNIELSPLKGISNFVQLKHLTQCPQFLESGLQKPRLLRALAALSKCPSAKIIRRTTYFSADSIVDKLIKHLQRHN